MTNSPGRQNAMASVNLVSWSSTYHHRHHYHRHLHHLVGLGLLDGLECKHSVTN
jgi:hypothetical protein